MNSEDEKEWEHLEQIVRECAAMTFPVSSRVKNLGACSTKGEPQGLFHIMTMTLDQNRTLEVWCRWISRRSGQVVEWTCEDYRHLDITRVYCYGEIALVIEAIMACPCPLTVINEEASRACTFL